MQITTRQITVLQPIKIFTILNKIFNSLTLTSKSAPAKTAALKSQFFKFAFLQLAMRKLMPPISLSSKQAPFKLAPSKLALFPPGSLKLQFLIEAPSKIALRPRTPLHLLHTH